MGSLFPKPNQELKQFFKVVEINQQSINFDTDEQYKHLKDPDNPVSSIECQTWQFNDDQSRLDFIIKYRGKRFFYLTSSQSEDKKSATLRGFFY
jgi:hypothetical protein